MANIHITQTSQFLVYRDGAIDQEWLDERLHTERVEAVKLYGRYIVHQTAEKGSQALKKAAHALVEGIDTYIASGQ